jgi:twitching motility protein PilT
VFPAAQGRPARDADDPVVEIKSLDSLGDMPEVIESFTNLKRGLVLVTGPTGSGKVDHALAAYDRPKINAQPPQAHIMTIEDPSSSSTSTALPGEPARGRQDQTRFRTALKHVLRQDPDVILVGELRDLDTISVALTAARRPPGCSRPLHTQSAQDTITRIVDVFPPTSSQQVPDPAGRHTSQGVRLPDARQDDRRPGSGRLQYEIMVCNSGIRAMTRDDKLRDPRARCRRGHQGRHAGDERPPRPPWLKDRADHLRGRPPKHCYQPLRLRDPRRVPPHQRVAASTWR